MGKIAIFVVLIFVAGCVRMRDYTGVRQGAFVLDVKKSFDKGTEKKNYVVLEEGVYLIVRDKKKEVISKIGLPDKVDVTLEGQERWEYEERKVNLFFRGDFLNSWELF